MADLIVLHSPVGGGHKAAALAVAEAARARGAEVVVIDAFDFAPRVFGKAYRGAHFAGQRAWPELYGSAYFAANHRGGAFEPVRRGIDHVAFLPLLKRICAMRPRAVVATHHLPLVVLGRARRKGWLGAPLVGVVTDYTAHACWAEAGVDAFAVACAQARRELLLHGVSPARVRVTGLPVRPAFDRIAPLRVLRAGEPLRVLVTSGGFGVGPVAKVIRSFAGIDDVELTVVCGNSKALEARAARAADRWNVPARILGFERDMPARVAEAHLVVGKAGGLTVSESLSAGRPLILVGAIPGNETQNEAFVVEGGAGIACAPTSVGAHVDRLRSLAQLERMGARARMLVTHDAAARVVDVALGRADGSSLAA